MPTVTKTFTYTGTTQNLIVPAGTTAAAVYLWGGGGGGGGGDQAGGGRTGSGSQHTFHATLSMTAHVGKTMSVGVGGGGAGGAAGGSAPGGASGRSLTGFSGGVGGTSGPNGSSGAGGGGGGATVITIDGNALMIAGGGGGGAGDGRNGVGTAGINSNSATGNSPGTLGENGANHNGDGGAGGAGGGGADGGTGGSGGSGDTGGTGGKTGSNLLPSGASEANPSGQTPGGSGDARYQAGVGTGGNQASSGGNGLAHIIFTVSPESFVKVGGAWKQITEVYTKKDGAWKTITAGYAKIGGAWKAIFNSGINFNSTSAGFGDASGGSTSGSAGSGGGGGGGGRVICTWLQNKGMFTLQDLQIDTEFSVKHLGRTTKIGYWFWAIPLVQYMQDSAETKSWFGGLVTDVIKVLAQARANELAYQMGKRSKGDILGKFTRWIGESFCFGVGFIVRPFVEHKFGEWLEVYDPEIR